MIRGYVVLLIKLINTPGKSRINYIVDVAMDGLDGNTSFPIDDNPVSLVSVLCDCAVFTGDVSDSDAAGWKDSPLHPVGNPLVFLAVLLAQVLLCK